MSKSLYDIKAVLLDLDGIIAYVRKASCESIEGGADIACTVDFPILYPFGLEASFWTSDGICAIGDFLSSLLSFSLPIGIISRGNKIFVQNLINSWHNIGEFDFRVIISSESIPGSFLKHDLIFATKKMNVPLPNLLVVGGSIFYSSLKSVHEMLSLQLISRGRNTNFEKFSPTFFADKLEDVLSIIKKGVLLSAGKLPNYFLSELLSKYNFRDASVIVGPSVGEDNAVIDVIEDEVLVVKSDPITFVTDSIGYYAVIVNSNDVATSGAMPRWMLSTLLFPPAISLHEVQKVFKELYETCSSRNIILCGGHTEITNSVSRPVVVGTIMGTVKRENLIDKKFVRTGDVVVMTKGAAMEGTAVIASEFRELLLAGGMSASDIDECLNFRLQLSILEEAKIAWHNSGVSALHDVTEGGILTAVVELSEASGYGVNICIDDIFIYRQTRTICSLLDIDALGLIGSGSLLICCNHSTVVSLLSEIEHSGIRATIIGEITAKGASTEASKSGKPCKLPYFKTDEITRLFS